MGNTFFYQKVKKKNSQITWKDILSESTKKHSRQELDYALSAGTSMNSATEENMLAKWHKPWVWFPVMKVGLLFVIALYALFYVTVMLTGSAAGLEFMVLILPPIVFPCILLIFLWELNIPKNISIYELLAYFLLGGCISFAVTNVMFLVVEGGPASYAAFREEPAKLAAVVVFLLYISKKKKIYGVTGLVLGAAVGAGFGGFESVVYAFGMPSFEEGIQNQLLRGRFALGGHVVFCAPYGAALALGMKNSKLSGSAFLSGDFLLTFAMSTAMHYVWNSDFGITDIYLYYAKNIAVIILLWLELLYIVKKCLYQVISIGKYRSGQAEDKPPAFGGAGTSGSPAAQGTAGRVSAAAGSVYGRTPAAEAGMVVCVGGALKGAVWKLEPGVVIVAGRGEGCTIRFPAQAHGVSRQHCSLCFVQGSWTVKDLNSSYGTYINGNRRLAAGEEQKLRSGDVLYLGTKENAFRVTLP